VTKTIGFPAVLDMSLFAKFRRFPEFHAMTTAISDVQNAEEMIIQSQERAFRREFRRYAKSHPGSVSSSLTAIADSGRQQFKINLEVFNALRPFTSSLEPLLLLESDFSKIRSQTAHAADLAEQSRQHAERAHNALSKLPTADTIKAQAAADAADAKYREDEANAAREQHNFRQSESIFQRKFLESLTTTLNQAIEVRMDAAEKMQELAFEFETAAANLEDFEDRSIWADQQILLEIERLLQD
jgi:hypothetical protein